LLQEYLNDFQIEPTFKDPSDKQEVKNILLDIPDLTIDIEYDTRYFKEAPL
jgi:hypothetical protein